MAFSKGVNPCFWSKNAIFFHYLFSLKIRLELRVNNVLDGKKPFFDYKDKIFHSLKTRTHAFVKKMPLSFNLFSVKSRLETVLTEFVE